MNTAAEIAKLLDGAQPGVPVPIPADLAERMKAELAERVRPEIEAIRRREYMPSRGDARSDWLDKLPHVAGVPARTARRNDSRYREPNEYL